MSRSLFDPSRMSARQGGESSPPVPPAAPPSGAPATRPPLSVAQLAAMIDATLRDHLPRKLRVVGEVSGFNDRTHWYFSLKDADAVVSCVMFASAARAVPFRPENGNEVVATGRVEFFAKQGRTQFYVEKLEPVGAGALDLEFKRLCDELRSLGWFAPERKRALPRCPARVCVITSKTSAAYQDVLDTFRRRAPGVAIALVDVRVQGDGAARQIAEAIRRAGSRHAELGIDAILVTRGGGSKEDLWTFNERVVAEAIVTCPVPVVAAIGHETDVTIAELVADERCATPTQAAMRLSPDVHAMMQQVDSYAQRLRFIVGRGLDEMGERLHDAGRHLSSAARSALHAEATRLERAAAGIERHRPANLYARREVALQGASTRLAAAIAGRLRAADPAAHAGALPRVLAALAARSSAAIDANERALELVGPASVLRRGYSATLRRDGSAVRSVSDVAPGETIRTVVADGSFASTVGAEGASSLPPSLDSISRPPRARPAKNTPPAGPSLFE